MNKKHNEKIAKKIDTFIKDIPLTDIVKGDLMNMMEVVVRDLKYISKRLMND